ncbi:hypothetical protein LTR15_001036 [Elasticomyces elasticus]|nr:hypothetical protein LTR15_001036 [Elasticomyces elasticus]
MHLPTLLTSAFTKTPKQPPTQTTKPRPKRHMPFATTLAPSPLDGQHYSAACSASGYNNNKGISQATTPQALAAFARRREDLLEREKAALLSSLNSARALEGRASLIYEEGLFDEVMLQFPLARGSVVDENQAPEPTGQYTQHLNPTTIHPFEGGVRVVGPPTLGALAFGERVAGGKYRAHQLPLRKPCGEWCPCHLRPVWECVVQERWVKVGVGKSGDGKRWVVVLTDGIAQQRGQVIGEGAAGSTARYPKDLPLPPPPPWMGGEIGIELKRVVDYGNSTTFPAYEDDDPFVADTTRDSVDNAIAEGAAETPWQPTLARKALPTSPLSPSMLQEEELEPRMAVDYGTSYLPVSLRIRHKPVSPPIHEPGAKPSMTSIGSKPMPNMIQSAKALIDAQLRGTDCFVRRMGRDGDKLHVWITCEDDRLDVPAILAGLLPEVQGLECVYHDAVELDGVQGDAKGEVQEGVEQREIKQEGVEEEGDEREGLSSPVSPRTNRSSWATVVSSDTAAGDAMPPLPLSLQERVNYRRRWLEEM